MLCRGTFGSGNFGYFNGGGMIFMMGFGLLIFLAVIFLFTKLMKPNTIPHFPQYENSPLNILDERFAKGEIDEEQYNKMKAALRNKAK